MTRVNRLLPVLILALWLLLAGIDPVAAQKPTPSDNDVNRVAKQLFCPVCENIPLDVCPTQACAEWRELIRMKIGAGWSDQQIKDYFALQYGDRVLSEPPRRGLNWLVYIMPPLLFLGGVVVVFTVLRRMRLSSVAAGAPAAAPSSPVDPSEDAYLRRVEEELKKQD